MGLTRVCLYTRISTDEENQPTSLHSQRERLQAFCQVQEAWRVVAHYEDRATGTSLDRPGLQAALDLARERRIDVLLVYRVDRLSRKVRQLAQLAEELDKFSVVLKSATEPFDTGTAAGRMMLQMLAVFAEFEHATIVDRITAGIERRAKQGHWPNGRVPFGYRRNDEKRLVPDEQTAPTVKQIFQLYTSGRLGDAAIARRLAAAQHDHDRTAMAEQRAALAKEIQQAERALDRYHQAFETDRLGAERFADRVSALDSRLEALREQDHRLAEDLATQAPTSRDTKELASVAQHLDQVIAAGDPKQAKALLRLLIAELRVNSRNEILPTDRVIDPSVCAPTSSVELAGLEPATSWVRSRRSPN
jgi:DNA invertase Pin-like site-specific DNA recombinase